MAIILVGDWFMVEDQEWKEAKKIGCILILCLLAFPSDWSCFPILCTNHIYKNQGNLKKQVLGMALYISMYVMVYCLCIDVVYGLLQFGIVLVYPIMSLYDGTRGKSTFMKCFFLVLCGTFSFVWIDSCNDVEGKMKILIFGMCNIGKSTVGEFLARKIGYDFIDMDAKIKEKYGTMLGFQDEYNDQYERDELRAEMISSWIKENENVVIALSPIAYLDAYEDFFEDSDIICFDLTDRTENVFKRLEFTDDNDNLLHILNRI